MSLAKLTLGTKMAAGFGLILTLLALMAAINHLRLSAINTNLDYVAQISTQKQETLANMMEAILEVGIKTRNIVLNRDAALVAQEKEAINKERARYDDDARKLETLLDTDRGREGMAKLRTHKGKVRPLIDKVITLAVANKTAEAESVLMGELRRPFREWTNDVAAMNRMQMEQASKKCQEAAAMSAFLQRMMLLVGGGIFLFGVFFAFCITRSITKPIKHTIEGLNEGAEEVAAASSQVSGASQSLAQGASEQAAALEETSASIEEMSSMTRQNADNASQADRLMQEASQVVAGANRSMEELTTSMREVSAASEETAKIIKTIDEIAFQTNLLALNAAVEAARAGEAGAGFAVVADEVRSLAMRAAEAARNTAGLIEGTVLKVKQGADLVEKTGGAFSQVSAATVKVKDLVAEIAAASSEQAQGVDQVNKAINEMNTVIQQVAADAEESASSSEELNSQAELMKDHVRHLGELVGGANGGGTAPPAGMLAVHRTTRGAGLPAVKRTAAQLDPEKIIPLEDGSFKDF